MIGKDVLPFVSMTGAGAGRVVVDVTGNRETVNFLRSGAEDRLKGTAGETSEKSCPGLASGFLAICNAAPTVLVVALPPVLWKSCPHGVESPELPPAVSTQLARMSAIVLIWSIGARYPVGRFNPGIVPVAVFTSWLIFANALLKALRSLDA